MAVSKEFVDVLLEEYRALRAEVTQRISSGTQLLGFATAAAALLAGTASKDVLSKSWVWALGAAIVLVLLVYWGWTARLVQKLGRHLAHLEARISAALESAGDGEPALTWERARHPPSVNP